MSVANSLTKKALTDLLTEMGTKNVETWSDDKIKKRLKNIPELLEENKLNEPESVEGLHTLETLLETLEVSEEIEFSEEEDLQEADVSDDSDGKPAKASKKRGRKPKADKEEKQEESIDRPSVAHTFTELEKPKLVKVTHAMAREWKEMQRYPNDREIQQTRLDHHKNEMKNGTHRGNEWVSCLCEETKEVYRLNGKHTSTAAFELFELGEKPEFQVMIRRYSAPTMADVAYLYGTFDPKWSSRTKADLLKGYSAVDVNLKDLPGRLVNIITAAVAFWKLETRYRKLSTEEQGTLLIQNGEFGKWVGEMLKDLKKSKHLLKMSVVAAMRATWEKDAKAAEEFWTKIRDDSNDDKNAPTRMLHKYLLGAKVSKSTGISEREVYVYCLKAWNAWRNEEDTVKLSHYKKDSKTPDIV